MALYKTTEKVQFPEGEVLELTDEQAERYTAAILPVEDESDDLDEVEEDEDDDIPNEGDLEDFNEDDDSDEE